MSRKTKSFYIREDQEKWLMEVSKASDKTMSKLVETAIDLMIEITEEHKNA